VAARMDFNADVDYEGELKALEQFYRELHGLTP
jgi:hypothetical protein